MFTDMVGYTALGQRNESLSLALVEEQRKVVRPILARHNGREVKTIGDAFLVEFPNAMDAVRCGYDIQRATREFNFSIAPEKRIHLRIGVHVGEVVESQGDIAGDAVNVASRIVPLAEDGGVCLTQQVYDHVHNKLDVPLVSGGKVSLKNVSEPVEVYRLVLPWSEEKVIARRQADKRRIAILPFANMSPDPNDEYFADGMTEELITTMSKISGLVVIARTSVIGYKGGQKRISEIANELEVGTVLESSVRKAGDRLRITVQLIDPQTSGHLWAESYDRELKDVFAIQTEVSKTVAEALKVQLLSNDREKIEKKPTTNLQAYDFYLKGLETSPWMIAGYRKDDIERSREYFEKAVELDPNFALAYAQLEGCYMEAILYKSYDERAPKAEAAARRALEIDGDLAEAHVAFADTLWHKYDFQGWERELKRAIELRPNYALAHLYFGIHLMISGRFDKAEHEFRKARELDPVSSQVKNWYHSYLLNSRQFDRLLDDYGEMLALKEDWDVHSSLADVHLVKGDSEMALEESKKALSLAGPGDKPLVMFQFACIYAKLGRIEEAKKTLRELQELSDRQMSEDVWEINMADIHYYLHDFDMTFRIWERAFDRHSEFVPFIIANPRYAELRSDPRFIELGRKLRITP